MSNNQAEKKRSGLGGNPLSLFTPTTRELKDEESHSEESTEKKTSAPKTSQARKSKATTKTEKSKHTQFLDGIEGQDKESIGLQVTTEINDWLDKVVKDSRRKHGKKLQKQVIIQAGVELLRSKPVEWSDIESIDELRAKLQELSSSIK